MTMKFYLPKSSCVECGYKANGCAVLGETGSGRVIPEPGDSTLCIKCGSLNIFAADFTLRAPTTDEMCASAINPEIQSARRTILEMRKRMEEEDEAAS